MGILARLFGDRYVVSVEVITDDGKKYSGEFEIESITSNHEKIYDAIKGEVCKMTGKLVREFKITKIRSL